MSQPWESRFWPKVCKTSTCWQWTAARTPAGYGVLKVDGETAYAHRLAYGLEHGGVPPGLDLDHLCRNPGCVNPAHLEAVTHRENMLRGTGMAARNAKKTHCPKGHPYVAGNLYMDGGSRRCRTCILARQKAARDRERENRRAT